MENLIQESEKLSEDIMKLVNDINLNFTGGSKEEFSEDSDKMIDNINGILNPEQSKDFKINFFKDKVIKYKNLLNENKFTEELTKDKINHKIKKYETKIKLLK